MSDFKSEGREYCIQNFAQCNICSKRACNSNPLEFEEKLSCIKCDPDENSNCNVIAENATATECTRTILGYKNECYTYTKRNVSHRGCLYEANENIFKECTDIFSESCLTCNQTNCNRDPIASTDLDFNEFHYEIMQDEGDKPKFTHCGNKSCTKINSWQRSCIKCDSTTNPNCATEFDPELAEFCPYAEEDLGCFHMVSGKMSFFKQSIVVLIQKFLTSINLIFDFLHHFSPIFFSRNFQTLQTRRSFAVASSN